MSPVAIFGLRDSSERAFTAPSTRITNSERASFAVASSASSAPRALSTMIWQMPLRSRMSMNTSSPKSRCFCTQPARLTVFPTSDARSVPANVRFTEWILSSDPDRHAVSRHERPEILLEPGENERRADWIRNVVDPDVLAIRELHQRQPDMRIALQSRDRLALQIVGLVERNLVHPYRTMAIEREIQAGHIGEIEECVRRRQRIHDRRDDRHSLCVAAIHPRSVVSHEAWVERTVRCQTLMRANEKLRRRARGCQRERGDDKSRPIAAKRVDAADDDGHRHGHEDDVRALGERNRAKHDPASGDDERIGAAIGVRKERCSDDRNRSPYDDPDSARGEKAAEGVRHA